MPEPILELKGISKRFPGVVALSDVHLSVSPGEVVALIGENGAGKSTLMKILGGVYQADEGSIRVDGREVQIRHVADAQKLGVSLIHQELNNLDNLDIGGNIFLGREPLSGGFLRLVDRKRIAEQSRGYLEKVGSESSSVDLSQFSFDRAAAARRNRQSALDQCPHYRDGRADLLLDAHGDEPPI